MRSESHPEKSNFDSLVFDPLTHNYYNPMLAIESNSYFFHHFVRNPFYAFPYIEVLKSLPTLYDRAKKTLAKSPRKNSVQ